MIFLTIFIILSAIRLGNRLADKAIAKRATAPPRAAAPIPTAKPIYKPIQIQNTPKPLPLKPQHVPDMDEIEYQRDRLRNLYTLLESIEDQLQTATKPQRIELLTRKQLTINAQIRRSQKIIQKELEK